MVNVVPEQLAASQRLSSVQLVRVIMNTELCGTKRSWRGFKVLSLCSLGGTEEKQRKYVRIVAVPADTGYIELAILPKQQLTNHLDSIQI
jgi:hypothetical protein